MHEVQIDQILLSYAHFFFSDWHGLMFSGRPQESVNSKTGRCVYSMRHQILLSLTLMIPQFHKSICGTEEGDDGDSFMRMAYNSRWKYELEQPKTE